MSASLQSRLKRVRVLGAAWTVALLGGACAQSAADRVKVGQTTEPELQASLGSPTARVQPSVRPQATVLYYADGSRFQLEGGVVRIKSRAPAASERTLQFWRQRWRAEALEDRGLTGTRGPHGVTERELRAGRLGVSVVYSAQTGEVIEVVEFSGGVR